VGKKYVPEPGSLAEKIDHLFNTVHPSSGPYTHQQVSDAIHKRGGPTISATYLWQLRYGKRDNPTMQHIEALSKFFGVPATYFFDDETTRQVNAQLELVASLRDEQVRGILLRTSGVSPQGLKALSDMADHVRKLEGLPDEAGDS